MFKKDTLAQFLSIALCVVAVGTASFLYGLSTKEAEWQAKVTDAAFKAQQAANYESANSANVSAQVDAKSAASTQSINTISQEVEKRLESQEPKIIYRTKVVNQCQSNGSETSATPTDGLESDQPGHDTESSVLPWRFDAGTVRLLNTARLGLSVEPATLGHAEGDNAASSVGVGEFASNDLQVVARYHALKVKHDALVDWVEDLKKRNLGLCVASEPLYLPRLEDP